jgi:transcriptional regulator with XRE-family HTH domain
MALGSHIQAWRVARGQSVADLAAKAGLPAASLDSIESGQMDPMASTLESLASAIGIPTGWLYIDPQHLKLLLADPDEDAYEPDLPASIDAATTQVFVGLRRNPELYALLTALIQNGDPKLLRAAEVNLRSLVKQSKQAEVPWQSRPPGHFEPPSD